MILKVRLFLCFFLVPTDLTEYTEKLLLYLFRRRLIAQMQLLAQLIRQLNLDPGDRKIAFCEIKWSRSSV